MSIELESWDMATWGRGVECAVKHNPDLELAAVFTRRDPETVKYLQRQLRSAMWTKQRR